VQEKNEDTSLIARSDGCPDHLPCGTVFGTKPQISRQLPKHQGYIIETCARGRQFNYLFSNRLRIA
jgi:hypothetical protein